MNKRIQELAEQANITIRGHYDETGSTPLELEKFAELIIEECSLTIQDFVDHRFPASEYPGSLKKHFGVK